MVRQLGDRLDVARVIQYLKVREQEEGGFSLTPDLYPDIEDTYYAIRTLQMLSGRADRRKTRNYLKTIDWSQVNSPRTLYMLVYLHVGLKIGFPLPLKNLLDNDWIESQTLDAWYFTDAIHKLLRKPFKPFDSLSSLKFHEQENLQALRKKVSISLDRGIDLKREEIIQWVHCCQNGDGGFGFYPGTTSFMENTYCALDILSKLKDAPSRTDACKDYILNCQTKSGGFGRAPMSFPFVESTFHAVSGLLFLKKMESKHR